MDCVGLSRRFPAILWLRFCCWMATAFGTAQRLACRKATLTRSMASSSDVRTLHANRFELDYTGLSFEDFKTENYRARIFHTYDLGRIREERQNVLARGERFQAELRARRKDGRYHWFLIRYTPLRDE